MARRSPFPAIGAMLRRASGLLAIVLSALSAPEAAAQTSFTPSDVTETTATLTLSGYTGAWSYKRITPTGGSCVSGPSGFVVDLSNLTADEAYTYHAYAHSACDVRFQTAAATFETLDLYLTNKTRTTADLTLKNWPSGQEWWYQEAWPSGGSCTSAGTGTSVTVSDLTKNTSYTYNAYSNASCDQSAHLGVEYFKTLPVNVLEASELTRTTVKLTLVNAAIEWRYQKTAGPGTATCVTVPKGTTSVDVSGLTENTDYTFTAYRRSCTEGEVIDWADFTTLPPAPSAPTALTATAYAASASLSWTAGHDGGSAVTRWRYRTKVGTNTWGAWTDVPGSGENTTGYVVTGLTAGTNHRFQVRAVNRGGDGAPSSESAVVVPKVVPSVNLSVSPTSVAEDASGTTVTVTASFSNSNTFAEANTVTVAVGSSGTATSGTDYAAVTDFDITVSANSTSGTGTFTLTPTQDAALEGSETIGVSGSATGLTVNSATLTLTDDDAAAVTVNDASASEGDSLTFTVTLDKAVQGGLTVTPSFTNGTAASTDYTANTTGLSFTGTAGETKSFKVATTEDAVFEANETFTVGLTVSVSEVTSTDEGTGTINNDDTAAVTVNDASASEGDAITFTVTLDKAVQGGLTVTPSYTNGTAGSGDYTENTSALTFAGTAGETETFTVSTTEDAVVEGDETFTVGLTVSNAPSGVTSTDTGTGTINNDDTASAVSLALSTSSVGEAAGATSVTVTVSTATASASARTVSVSVGSSGTATSGTDYAAVTDFDITLAANQTSATGTFTLTPTQDAVLEGDETIIVSGTATGLTVNSATLTLTDDDSAAVTVNDASASEGDAMTFTVTLDKAVQGGLTVTPSYTDVSATKGTDYTANTTGLSFTGTAGETKTFTVSTTEDTEFEGDETFTVGLTVSNAPSGVTSTDTGTGTINDDESATVTVNDASASEGDAITFTVTLSDAVSGGLTVTPSYTNGTAASTDYTANTTALTFTGTAGETETFTVSTTEDAVFEANETFTVGLTASVSGVTSTDTGTGTINNDDAAAVTVNDASASEGDDITFTVTLDKAVQGGLKVTPSFTDVSAVEGTDYDENTTALTFTGTAGETETFKVSTTEDAVFEGAETFTVGLSVSGAPSGVTSTDTGTGTINNDDSAAVTVNDASASEGDAMTFTVTLDKAVQGGLKVTPSYTNGTAASTDYTANTTALTFTGTAGETQTFTVSTTEDAVFEGNETFTVGLTASVSGVTSTDTGTGTINNDDAAAVTVNDASASEGDDITFTVTLSEAVQGGLTVTPSFTDVSAVEGTDYDENTAALTFTGTKGETKDFTVSTDEDTVFEGNETFTVGLTASVSGVTSTDTGTGTINDDDSAAVTVNDASASEGDAMTFTVTLDKAVQGGLTVTPSYTNGTAASSDYTANTTALSFTGTAGETETFTVSTTEDAVFEANETFTVGLTASVSGVTSTDTGTGTINNDDSAAVTVNDASASEGDDITFTVTLSEAVQGGLTVTPSFTDVSAVEGTDYDENTTALTFTGTKGETKDITVSTDEDTVFEGNETFTVGLTASVSGVTSTDTGTGTINDDDSAAVTVNDASASEGESMTFTVTLDKAVQGGLTVTPSYTNGTAASSDYTANTTALTFTGTAGETETFTVSTTEDAVVEGNETFTVGLSVSNAPSGVTSTDTGTGTINDDDTASSVSLAVNPSSVGEGASGTSVTVTASTATASATARTVTVSVGSSGTAKSGTDYAAVTGFDITIAANQTSATNTFTLTPTQDAVFEGNETIIVSGTVTGLTVNSATLTLTDDDVAAVTVNDASASEGDSLTFTVTLDKAVQDGLTVTPSFTDVSATKGTDYTANTTGLSFTGTAGETKSFKVATTEDAVLEGGETFTVGLTVSSAPSGVTSTDTGTGTIDNDDSAAVTVNDASASEGDALTFTVTLDKAVQGGLKVTPSYTDGTAASTDYTENTTALTFTGTASETKTFTVSTTEDEVVERDETFTVGLTVSDAPSGVTSTDTGTGTINNDDTASSVSLAVNPSSVSEGAAATSVTVTASVTNAFGSAQTVTVSVGSSGTATSGTDYAAVTDFDITLPANQETATGTFTLTPTQDAVFEGDETIVVSGAATGLTVNSATLTLTDDDAAAVTVNDASASEGDAMTFTVTLDKAVQGGLKVTPSYTNGTAASTDYTANTTALTFTGTAGETQTFAVSTTEDDVVEGDETFTVGLTVSDAPSGVTATDTGTGTINNDDTASALSLLLSPTSVGEGAGATTVTVTASTTAAFASATAVTVSVGSGGTATSGTDYAAVAAFDITIPADATSGTGTFTLTPTDDAVVEGDETIIVSGSATGLTVNSATLTLTDDDEVSEVNLDLSPTSVGEGAGATTVTVTASSTTALASPTAVTVSVGSGGTATSGTDYAAVAAFDVAVPANQTSGTATFTLTPTDDAVVEGNETIVVSGSSTGLTVNSATLTLTDDDAVSEVTLEVSPTSVGEGAEATTVTVTASTSTAFTSPTAVTVSVGSGGTATSGTDYAAVAAFDITLPANQTSGTGTFTLTPTDDAVVEGDESIVVSGSAGLLTVNSATLTLTDDDEAAGVTLKLSPARVGEGAGVTTVTVTASTASTFAQAKAVTVSVGSGGTATSGADYAAVADFDVTIPANATRGTATFTLTPTDDEVVEGDETIAVSGAAAGLEVGGAMLALEDNDTAAVTVDDASASEGDAITFTVTLDKAVRGGLTVTPSFTDVSAAKGSDYEENTTALSFSGTAGETRTLVVSTTEDALVEGDETFTVGLTVSNALPGVTSTDTGTGTIRDDDAAPAVTLALSPASVGEGAGATEVTVTASFSTGSTFAADAAVTVSVGTEGTATSGTDYAAVADFDVTIPANATSGTATFTLTPTDDSVVEGDETIVVSGAAAGLEVNGATLALTDDDAVPTLQLAVDPTSVEEGASATVMVTASFSTAKTFAEDQVVTIRVGGGTATPGTDYQAVADFDLTIPAGEGMGTGTFTLTPTDDSVVEGDETIEVSGAAAGLEVNGATLALTDDDAVPTLQLAVDPTSVEEGASATVMVTASFSTAKTFAEDQVVTIRVGGGTATPGTDYQAVADFDLTIPAGEGMGTGTFMLATMEDGAVEGDETIEVSGAAAALTVVGTLVMVMDATEEGDRDRALEIGLAGMGRTIATQAVDVIGGRFEAAERVSRGAGSSGGLEIDPLGLAGILHAGGADVSGFGPGGVDALGLGAGLSGVGGSAAALGGGGRYGSGRPMAARPVTLAAAGSGGGLSLWASGARTDYSGRPADFSADGTMSAAYVGMDLSFGSVLTIGVAASRGRGTVDMEGGADWRGDVGSELTTVYPYLRLSPVSGLDLWGMAGVGRGDLELTDREGALDTPGSLEMAAAGLRGDLARGRALGLALRADAFTVAMAADEVTDAVADAAEPLDGRAQRVRLLLDASAHLALSGSSRLTPSVEVGARADGGEVETGLGMEVGGGLAYANTRLGLDISARGRWLAAHDDEHFDEWGANVSIRRVPADPRRGLSLLIEPTWGEEASGVAALWEGRTLRRGAFGFGMGPEAAAEPWRPDRLDVEMAYGMGLLPGGGSLKPFGQLRMMGAGSRHVRVGTRLALAGSDAAAGLRLEVLGEQRVRAGGAPNYGAGLGVAGGDLRFAGGLLAPFGEVTMGDASTGSLRFGTRLRPDADLAGPLAGFRVELAGEAYKPAGEAMRYGVVLRGGVALGLR